MYFAMMIGVHKLLYMLSKGDKLYNNAFQFSSRLNNILLATASDL